MFDDRLFGGGGALGLSGWGNFYGFDGLAGFVV